MKPEFDYYNFEDYLFKALEYARSLNTPYADEEEVLRYLRLAQRNVELFVKKMKENRNQND